MADSDITLRATKGSALTHTEADQNFDSLSGEVDVKTLDYTVLITDQNKHLEFNGTDKTATLPTVSSADGIDTGSFLVHFKNLNSTDLTIDASGAETIEGAADFRLVQWESVTLRLDAGATEWNLASNPVNQGKTQEWTETQNFNATSLSDGANISWNLQTNQVAKVTLAGNRTLDNPTNLVDGATYILTVTQDATGTRTLAYGTAYKWPQGVTPTLSTGAADVDILSFVCDGTNMYGVATLNLS